MVTPCKRSLKSAARLSAATMLAMFLGPGLGVCAEQGGPPQTWQALTRDYVAAANRVAQADVASAVAYNNSVPNGIPRAQLEFLRAAAQAAQARLVSLEAGKPMDPAAGLVTLAEANLKNAQEDYNRLLNQAGLVNVLEEQIAAAKARVDLAQAKLALVKAIGEQPAEIRHEWQTQLLLDELVSMRHAIDSLSVRE